MSQPLAGASRLSGAEQQRMTPHPNRSKRAKAAADFGITQEKVVEILDWIGARLVKGVGTGKRGEVCIEAAVCNVLEGRHADDPVCVAPLLRDLKIGVNDAAWSSNEARAAGLRRLGIAQLGSAGFLDESEFIGRLCGVTVRKLLPGALRAAASIHPAEEHKAKLIEVAGRCEAVPEIETAREARQFRKASAASAAIYAADAASAAYAASAARYAADAAYAASTAIYAADAAYAASAAIYAADAAYAAERKKQGGAARDGVLAAFCEEVVQILIAMNAPGCQWLGLAVGRL